MESPWDFGNSVTLQPASMNIIYNFMYSFWSWAQSLHNEVCPMFTASFVKRKHAQWQPYMAVKSMEYVLYSQLVLLKRNN